MALPPRQFPAYGNTAMDGHGPMVVPLATGATQETRLQIDVKDWDLLFEAIQWYLCATIDGHENKLTGQFDMENASDTIRAHVLDSVDALQKLHRALHHERSLLRQS